MLSIKSLGSSSKGNCYLINDSKTTLMIECGLTINSIKKGGDYKTHEIAGCLLSHEHQGDHSKAAKDIINTYGVPVYTSELTAKALGLNLTGVRFITHFKKFSVGSFEVLPVEAIHDAVDPMGFYIKSKENGDRLLFMTDTKMIRHQYSGMNYIMAECNYSRDILLENYYKGKIDLHRKSRIERSHLSLESLMSFLNNNDLSKVRKIYLMHLSDLNSDEKLFKSTIEKKYHIEVEVFPA